jgi:hypothetical protein
MELFTRGNRKLPKTTLIWNLPADKTCPGATDECRKFCYAKKAERIYPQVLPSRELKYKISLQEDFSTKIIFDLYSKKNWNTVRIHESGDFYSQEYFDKWVRIAKQFTNKIFYAYTKSFHLDFSKRPDNFIMIASADKPKKRLRKLLINKGVNGIASVVPKDYKREKAEVICPGDCKICNYCFIPTERLKEIKFKQH